MRKLQSTPKGYTSDSDKLCTPGQTVARVKALMAGHGGVLAQSHRTDTGRLGIPVYLSICGPKARHIMPTRKQMGKGASPEQAEASGLMELAERYSYFSFWAEEANFTPATWSQAETLWPGQVMPVAEIIQSVGDTVSEAQAREILDLITWLFHPATRVIDGQTVMVPLNWFKKLNEFNGSSAGNCLEESIMQGACELVERHVSAVIDKDMPRLPTIRINDATDPVLAGLVEAFEKNGVLLWLKDFSLGMPVPTVAALAYDPATFPVKSEIVFTAGTASSPAKAAVRAITEIAQLAGDFETGSNYEASGLRKFKELQDIRWVTEGPETALDSLPSLDRPDMLDELIVFAQGLAARGYTLYTVETTHPELGIATNYNFVPGFQFRERTPQASIGLFVGRMLAEEAEPEQAAEGLARLAQITPGQAYLPFFQGLLALRLDEYGQALDLFTQAEPLHADPEDTALAVFYQAYALTRMEEWAQAEILLCKAIAQSPEVKEFFNLRGVCRFKQANYTQAAGDFESALALDSGSAMDLANLGLCHKFLGHNAAASEFLSKALEMDPDLEFARTHLSELDAVSGGVESN